MTIAPAALPRRRGAFFYHPDVFEDFYPHFGVTQESFATEWDATGSHTFVSLLQKAVADVTWVECSLDPVVASAQHTTTGARVRFAESSRLHQLLWRMFYRSHLPWHWKSAVY